MIIAYLFGDLTKKNESIALFIEKVLEFSKKKVNNQTKLS